MSRCFPFPPPGYVKKPRSSSEQGEGDLLAKDNHKEKKHKKEKKDKEKRGSKERKDKDRSKDKHKEKKERKEKHKDTKKVKDKNKAQADPRTEHRSEIHNEGELGYNSRKAEEVGDSKFTEELGRRIRDDEQVAADHMVEGFSSTMHRRNESMGVSTAMGKECITSNNMVTYVSSTLQRRDEKLTPSFHKKAEGTETASDLEKQKVASSAKVPNFTSTVRRNEKLTPPVQKRTEGMCTTTIMEKQGASSNQKVGDFSSAEQRNHVSCRPMENLSGSVKRKNEGTLTFNSMQKEMIMSNCTASSPVRAATKRNDVIGQPVESGTSSVPGRADIRWVTPEMKERPMLTTILPTEQKRTGGMGLPIEKHELAENDTDKKPEGKEKTKEVTGKNLEGNEKNKEKKRKEKDKDRHREKKREEKKRGKGEHKHSKHNKVGENGMNDHTDNLVNKIRAPHIENVKTADTDGNIKKRKELEVNGFLHEPQHDGRPHKLPRTSASSSHFPMEDEMMEFRHNAAHCASIKIGAINNMEVERCLDNNSNHINGKTETMPSLALGSSFHSVAVNSSISDQVMPKLSRPPAAAVEFKRSDQVPSMTPHPDTKYLSTIYSIPRTEELVEFDRVGGSEALIKRLDHYGKLRGHTGCVNTVHFNPTGDLLVSGSDDKEVILWNWAAKSKNFSFASGHLDNVFQARIMPFTDDRTIVTSAADGQVRLALISENGKVSTKKIGTHRGRVHKLAIEPGSPHIFYSCGEDGLVQHFDLRNTSPTKLFTCSSFSESKHPVRLNSIVIDPRNPNYFALGGFDEYARVYDIRQYQSDATIGSDRPVDTFSPHHLIGTDVHITALAYSIRSELLISYNDELIYLFQKEMGMGPTTASTAPAEVSQNLDQPQVYTGHRNSQTVKGVNFFGPNDECVVTGSDCGHVYIWKKGGELVRMMVGDKHIVNCVEPHPFIPFLATSGFDKSVKLWGPIAEKLDPLPENVEEIVAANKQGREARARITLSPDVVLRVLRLQQRQGIAFVERRPSGADDSDEDGEREGFILRLANGDAASDEGSDGDPRECNIS